MLLDINLCDSYLECACSCINGLNGNLMNNYNMAVLIMEARKRIITIYDSCDRACKDRPCECKLHQVIFLLISSVQNVASISFLLVAEESPLNSAVVTKMMLQYTNSKVMMEQ